MANNNSLLIPALDVLIDFQFWEIHEAAFILTTWPQRIITTDVPYDLRENIGRKTIYVSDKKNVFPRGSNLEKNYFKTVSKMEGSIRNGEFIGFEAIEVPLFSNKYYNKKLSYVIPPKGVILWALLNGYVLPKALQDKFRLYQIDSPPPSVGLKRKTQSQIIGQFLLVHDPQLKVSSICDHHLMKALKMLSPNVTEQKTIRRDMNELFDKKGKAGPRSKTSSEDGLRRYMHKPLNQVLQKDPQGLVHIQFCLLTIVIKTAFKIKIVTSRESILKMTESEFINDFFEDAVMKLYFKDVSPYTQTLERALLYLELVQWYSNPNYWTIPFEIRNSLSIEELFVPHGI